MRVWKKASLLVVIFLKRERERRDGKEGMSSQGNLGGRVAFLHSVAFRGGGTALAAARGSCSVSLGDETFLGGFSSQAAETVGDGHCVDGAAWSEVSVWAFVVRGCLVGLTESGGDSLAIWVDVFDGEDGEDQSGVVLSGPVNQFLAFRHLGVMF